MVARTSGVYEFDTATIKIHTEELATAQHTVGVVVHELAHHVAYQVTKSKEKAGDLTRDHADAMEVVAGLIFRRLAQGKYDELLNDVTW
jgi:predicted SprT family Zn-dependent metalloprotease